MLQGWFDGGSRGNPGVAGSGWLLRRDNKKILERGYHYCGDAVTNNEAEYRALILLLEHAAQHETAELRVFGDSLLVIQQMKGVWQIRHPRMRELHAEATTAASKIGVVHYQHVLRQFNRDADLLSNIAMDTRIAGYSEYPEPDSEPESSEAETEIAP